MLMMVINAVSLVLLETLMKYSKQFMKYSKLVGKNNKKAPEGRGVSLELFFGT